jgi:hypothetical protein
MNTGLGQFGRPSMGSWVTYGLGSEAEDLPGFVVLQSGPRGPRGGAVNWGSGFLPTTYQGVPLRAQGDPILNLSTPKGISADRQRQRTLDAVRDLNRIRLVETGDPEIATRIAAYEMAYRMQPAPRSHGSSRRIRGHARSLRHRPENPPSPATACSPDASSNAACASSSSITPTGTATAAPGEPGKRLREGLPRRRPGQAALVKDLKRAACSTTPWSSGAANSAARPWARNREKTGRNHHIDAFTMWFAGGGVKAGAHIHGETDELGFSPCGTGPRPRPPRHPPPPARHRPRALTFRFQGRDFRLTDIAGEVVSGILA